MASVLEQALSVGVESSYNSEATPTVAFEASADDWRQIARRSEPGAYKRGQRGQLAISDRLVRLGAQGTVRLHVPDNGLGPILAHLFEDRRSRTDPAGHRHLYNVGPDGPSGSLTIDVYRVLRSGDGSVHRYAGCVATGMGLDWSVGSALTMDVSFDAASEGIAAGAVAPPYPDAATFPWTDTWVRIAGETAPGVRSAAVRADFGMRRPDGGRRVGVGVRKRPLRMELPGYAGALEGLPTDLADWLRWERDEPFTIAINTEHRTAGGLRRQFSLFLGACKYDEARVRSHPNRLTAQHLPFRSLESGTNVVQSPLRLLVRDGTAG